MKTAIFVTENKNTILEAEDIKSRKDYYEHFHGHLICPHPGCSSQLEYVSSNHPYFRTVKGGEHMEECPFNVIRKPSAAGSNNGGTYLQLLSDSHIKNILKDTYKNVNNPAPKKPTYKGSVSRQKNPNLPLRTSKKAVASLDADAEPIMNGEREQYVRKRWNNDLMDDDIGTTKEVHGYIDRANVCDDYIELFFEAGTTSIMIYNAFHDKSLQAFEYAKKLGRYLNTSGEKIFICSVGNVEKKDNGIQSQIMAPEHITFNNLDIYNFVLKNNL